MAEQNKTINIAPNPRILRMLGEIDFKAWQCLCEIIDNSIDAFPVDGYLQKKRTVKVKLPAGSQNNLRDTGVLTVEDNGRGMTVATLRDSLRAGFSSNNPVDKLGLFGMGFNIATARLGSKTKVITSTKDSDEIITVTIDFSKLEAASTFDIPLETRPKTLEERNWHGTKIEITQLRTEHVKPLYQRKRQKDKLGKIYGRVIRERNIKIKYDGDLCKPFIHCVWAKERHGNSSLGPIPAIIDIDHKIDEKPFCHTCWVWLSARDLNCPSCGKDDALEVRERRVRGWVGLQRYFDGNHYGFDLIRNGRVIRELDKSMFDWVNHEEEVETEYPIDGFQSQGRFVGEIELDFVRVSHQKDAFETDSSDWRDAVRVIRGDGPLRPMLARNMGYPVNDSPLSKLFQAFRNAKKGVANLVPARANGQAMLTDAVLDDLLFRFKDGQAEYQNDDKWWAIVNEINQKSDNRTSGGASGPSPFGDDKESIETTDVGQTEGSNQEKEDIEDYQDADADLSRNYSLHDLFPNVSVRVMAWKSSKIIGSNGFQVKAKGGELTFVHSPNDSIYDEILLTPADFLINELAFHFHKIAMNELSIIPLTQIELALREKYFPELLPSIQSLRQSIKDFIDEVKTHLLTKDASMFDLSHVDQEQMAKLKKRLSRNRGLNQQAIEQAMMDGSFLNSASLSIVASILKTTPEMIFDDTFFQNTLSLQDDINELNSIVRELEWFEENHQFSGSELWRARVRRLIGSLAILASWRL